MPGVFPGPERVTPSGQVAPTAGRWQTVHMRSDRTRGWARAATLTVVLAALLALPAAAALAGGMRRGHLARLRADGGAGERDCVVAGRHVSGAGRFGRRRESRGKPGRQPVRHSLRHAAPRAAARQADEEAPDARLLRRRLALRHAGHHARAADAEERPRQGEGRLRRELTSHVRRAGGLAGTPQTADERRPLRRRRLHDRRQRQRHADGRRRRLRHVSEEEVARGVRAPGQADRRRSCCTPA